MSITASIILFLIKCGVVLKKNINYYTVTEHLLRSLMVISVKMVFLKQASQWPDLVKQWNTVEVNLLILQANQHKINSVTTQEESKRFLALHERELQQCDMNRISDLFKLVYMVGCFIITSHSASALHQESKVPAKILFSVPAESYNTDVARFQVQACQYNTVITGCNYFSITKSFMLTVAGTIVTYEIVLLQFGSLVYYKVPSNMTQFCNGLKGATYSESSR
ncbi:uncharacterized protein LOC124354227 [Homalodisca vitripennis]|uniref:uncharacterized protein LOC124354227 n=1 Tax=Homalodisca vitripennis TaxID=197043 RepID=UPI001EEB3D0E|nr:uncharacterized protein LOC124354227 [Homalodisca vitripennis]